jgi:long-chain acyl-CoA synthetase
METIVDLFKNAAVRTPTATALAISPGFRQQRWSYLHLWETAGKTAALLQERGLEKGDRAIIWAPNMPEWVIAFVGCLRAGVTAVPLDARSSADFVERVFEQTEAKLVFLSRHAPLSPEDMSAPSICLEELEDLVEGVHANGHEPPIGRGDIAEIIFTSGTTGDPKGVILTHGNILSNVLATSEVVPLKPSNRLLSLMPLSHMMEQTAGLLVPIHNGARVVYPVSRQPTVIFKTLRTNQITNVVLVPQALQLFMNAIEREVKAQGKEKQWQLLQRLASALPMAARRLLFRPIHRQMGGRIQFFTSGGSYLEPELAEKWAVLGIPILQGYGTTEASPIITTNSLNKRRSASVGRALPGQEVRIAADGEVLTRGPNVTQGYWRNPEATTAVFSEDGWYKTGDLGILDDQGFLYLKGRKKDLIVLANGQNVYPEDIESALNRQPEVRDSAVVGLDKDGGDVEVHAVLLVEDGREASAIVHSANMRLADHQQIRGFTVWPEEDFPRSHTLKVKKPKLLEYLLRQAQKREEQPVTVATGAVAAPQSDFQRVVASTCSVPVGDLTPEKTLDMDLGLDSLGRVELLSAIEQQLGAYVDDEKVGPATTLGELEAMVQAGGKEQRVPFPSWGRHLWCRVLRAFLHYALIFPILRILYSVKVYGREHLKGLESPVLFASNHNAMLDSPLTLMTLPMTLPFKWRRRLCPAAEADVVFGPRLKGMVNVLLGNAFPFAREGAVRSSLENLGKLLDMGWSILIYPEGDRFLGEMDEFKAGTGLIAVGSLTPVIPVRVKLLKGTIFDNGSLLSRGKVEIHFGQPLTFSRGTSPVDATRRLEEAVRAL